MTWLDIVFIAILCMAAGLGFWSGLMWQLYGLFCLVLAYFAGLVLYGIVAGPFEEGLGTGTARTVGYASVFVATFLLSYGLGILARRVFRLRPGRVSRVLGLFLGLFQASLVCGVVAVSLVYYSSGSVKQLAESSKVVMVFAKGTRFLTIFIPGGVKDGFATVREKSDEIVEGAKKKVEGVMIEDSKERVKGVTGSVEGEEGKVEEAEKGPQGEK